VLPYAPAFGVNGLPVSKPGFGPNIDHQTIVQLFSQPKRDRHTITLLFRRHRMRQLKGDTAGATTTDVAAFRLPGQGGLV